MGKDSSTPSAPDYNSLIPLQEQANINQQEAQVNSGRVNTYTPYGSTTWTPPGGTAPPTGATNGLMSPNMPQPITTGGPIGGAGPRIMQGTMQQAGNPYSNSTNSGSFNLGQPNLSGQANSATGGNTGLNSSLIGGSAPSGSFGGMSQMGGGSAYPSPMQADETGAGESPQQNSANGLTPLQQQQYNSQFPGGVPPGSSSNGTPGSQVVDGVDFGAVNAPYQSAAAQGPWTETQTLSAPQQQILNEQQGLQTGQLGAANTVLGNNFNNITNTPNLTGMMSSYGLNPGAAPQYQMGTESAQQVAQGTYNSEMGLLQPQLNTQTQNLNQQLGAEGFDSTGGTAGGAQTAQNNLQDQQALIQQSAAGQALSQGNQFATDELQRGETALQGNEGLFGLSSQTAQQQYGLPINAISALSSGTQVNTPGLNASPGAPGISGTDILGTEQTGYGNSVGAYNAGQAAQGNIYSGLFGLGEAGLLSQLGQS